MRTALPDSNPRTADPAAASARAIDWSQLLYPGPTRRFTPDELHRAGRESPGRTFWLVLVVNVGLASAPLVAMAPAGVRLPLVLAFAVVLAALVGVIRVLWRRPHRGTLNGLAVLYALLAVVAGLLSRLPAWPLDRPETAWFVPSVGAAVMAGVLALYGIAMFRSHQVAGRLAELAEREHGLALARRLSAAQLQPHFLFNTLASIQHWVDTQDPRAGSSLRSLTQYLRALLPMFEHALHPLGDELHAMARYLEVMHTRLGDRIAWSFQCDPAADLAPLPPGLGLTLLENAVEHGVQASLHGAAVRIESRIDADGQVVLCIEDTGPGPVLPLPEGIGLSNCRHRLRQSFGDAARLEVAPGVDGTGCRACVTFPAIPPSDALSAGPALHSPSHPHR